MNEGLLTGSLTYLVGGIENAKDCYSWRIEVAKKLNNYGVKVLDPNNDHFVNLPTENDEDRNTLKLARLAGDWGYVHEYMAKVISRDVRMVDLSTFLIAHIDPEIPTWGSVHELVIATQQNKAVLVHTSNKKNFPLWMAGLLKMDLVFDNWDDLIEYIRKIHFKEIEANPKYWKILSHE